MNVLIAVLALAVGAEARIAPGESINGKKLYSKECAPCHGDAGTGGRTGISLTDSGRMNLIPNERMFELIKSGAGLKKASDHKFDGKLKFLDIWDVISYMRSLHMGFDEFFPQASRYVSKSYTIDNFGLERMEKATGKKLEDKSAAVFTFFNFPGEEGHLQYVPQDPIKLDQLKKDKKAGYLVFMPFKSDGFDGELGIGMEPDGKMTVVKVLDQKKGADLLNKSLSRFRGLGKKGQKEPFKIGGGKPMEKLADDLYPVYLRAMETVTMYDREEAERTWADE
jgi:cytochrome c